MMACGNISVSPIEELLDRSVCEMTHRVAGLELTRTFLPKSVAPDWGAFTIKTVGDYEAVLILDAEKDVLYEITRRMKRNPEVSMKEVVVYATEYYNILCGFFISHLNNRLQIKARFGIPEFSWGQAAPSDRAAGCRTWLQYKCRYGSLQISGYGLPVR